MYLVGNNVQAQLRRNVQRIPLELDAMARSDLSTSSDVSDFGKLQLQLRQSTSMLAVDLQTKNNNTYI